MSDLKTPAALAIILFLALSGCSRAEDPHMDHTEAMAELNGLFEIAQDAVVGEWEAGDDGAEPCSLPSGAVGVKYVFARYGPALPPDQHLAVVNAVVADWSANGLTASAGTSTLGDVQISTARYPENGWGDDGLYIELRVGVNGSSILGQTRCVPGNAGRINEEYHEQPSTPSSAVTPHPPS
jgi:hypothetical protein